MLLSNIACSGMHCFAHNSLFWGSLCRNGSPSAFRQKPEFTTTPLGQSSEIYCSAAAKIAATVGSRPWL